MMQPVFIVSLNSVNRLWKEAGVSTGKPFTSERRVRSSQIEFNILSYGT